MDVVYTILELPNIVATVFANYKTRKVWAFHAPMGAGKTTFIHALCSHLGVIDSVSSPTFAIINHYKSNNDINIVHMDWYRLKGVQEAIATGVEEVMYEDNFCLIEWPEIAEELLPDDALHIYLQLVNDKSRRLIIDKGSPNK